MSIMITRSNKGGINMVKTAKEIVKQKLEKAISSYNKYSNDENKKGDRR